MVTGSDGCPWWVVWNAGKASVGDGGGRMGAAQTLQVKGDGRRAKSLSIHEEFTLYGEID